MFLHTSACSDCLSWTEPFLLINLVFLELWSVSEPSTSVLPLVIPLYLWQNFCKFCVFENSFTLIIHTLYTLSLACLPLYLCLLYFHFTQTGQSLFLFLKAWGCDLALYELKLIDWLMKNPIFFHPESYVQPNTSSTIWAKLNKANSTVLELDFILIKFSTPEGLDYGFLCLCVHIHNLQVATQNEIN